MLTLTSKIIGKVGILNQQEHIKGLQYPLEDYQKLKHIPTD